MSSSPAFAWTGVSSGRQLLEHRRRERREDRDRLEQRQPARVAAARRRGARGSPRGEHAPGSAAASRRSRASSGRRASGSAAARARLRARRSRRRGCAGRRRRERAPRSGVPRCRIVKPLTSQIMFAKPISPKADERGHGASGSRPAAAAGRRCRRRRSPNVVASRRVADEPERDETADDPADPDGRVQVADAARCPRSSSCSAETAIRTPKAPVHEGLRGEEPDDEAQPSGRARSRGSRPSPPRPGAGCSRVERRLGRAQRAARSISAEKRNSAAVKMKTTQTVETREQEPAQGRPDAEAEAFDRARADVRGGQLLGRLRQRGQQRGLGRLERRVDHARPCAASDVDDADGRVGERRRPSSSPARRRAAGRRRASPARAGSGRRASR